LSKDKNISKAFKLLQAYESHLIWLDHVNDPEIEAERELYNSSFKEFVKAFWDDASTGNTFIDGMSVTCITDHIDAMLEGELNNVLFSLPLREGKSTILSVLLPAYVWTKIPRTRFLTATYNRSHAYRDNTFMQNLIKGEHYQKLYGKDFQILTENQQRTYNSENGQRFAFSFQSGGTGEGGDWVVFDDPNDLNQVQYENHRRTINNTFDHVIYNRRNKFNDSFLVGAMHRSHPEDLFGHILSKQDPSIIYVPVPMEFEVKRRTVSVSPISGKKIWEDPRVEDGQLLSPNRYTPQDIKDIKLHTGMQMYNSLYQCQPSIESGNILLRDWFQMYKHEILPDFELIVQSWDTALSVNIHSAYSASTTYGVFLDDKGDKCLMLLNTWYGKLEFPELLETMRRQSINLYDTDLENPIKGKFRPDYMLVEAKANGLSLIQSLRKVGVTNCLPYNPPKRVSNIYGKTEEGKIMRARMVSPIIESGRVYLPGRPASFTSFEPYADHFLTACTNFPMNIEAARDIVDTLTMTLDFLQSKNILMSNSQVLAGKKMTDHRIPGVNTMRRSYKEKDSSFDRDRW